MTVLLWLATCTLSVGAALATPQDADPPAADPTAILQQAGALLQQGDPAGAQALLETVTEDHPENPTAWMLLGYALHAQQKYAEALPAHEKAAGFPATAANAGFNAACASARLGDVDGALDWLGKAVAAGFSNRQLMTTDADLASVRGDPRFGAVLPPLLDGPELFVERPRVIHTFEGEAAGDQFGWVARDVGDLDADGVHDFAATAPTHASGGPGAGRVYVHSGASGEVLFTRDGQPGWQLGTSVAGGGDVDGDGTPDVLAGAPGNGPVPGRALVYSGRDGALLHDLSAGEAGDRFGMKVCALEDLDDDGCAEIVVGAAQAGGDNAGRVYVYSGKTARLLDTIDGPSPGAQFGSSADATLAGGHRLLIVGAMGEGGTGRCHVYRCAAEGAEPAFTVDPDATSRNLGQYFVSILGDVDGDGVPDVYGSDWNNAAGGNATGRVFVHSGASGERILTLTGSRAGEGFGTSPSACGDVNGDGHADLIVGAWQNAEAAPSGGKCYLYSGKDGALLRTITSRQAGDTLGFDAVGLGDVDGDGATDFLLTSAWSPVHGPQTGRVFVIAGEPAVDEG